MKKGKLYQFKIYQEECLKHPDKWKLSLKDDIVLFLEFGGSYRSDHWTFLAKEGIVNYSLEEGAILTEEELRNYLSDEDISDKKAYLYLEEIK